MQEKTKMILQKNENLLHVQQQYDVSFCEKIDSKSGFSQQIWHYQCLIFMILIRTKYLENPLSKSSLSQYSIAKILFIPGSLDNSKMPFEQLFLDDPLYITTVNKVTQVFDRRRITKLYVLQELSCNTRCSQKCEDNCAN